MMGITKARTMKFRHPLKWAFGKRSSTRKHSTRKGKHSTRKGKRSHTHKRSHNKRKHGGGIPSRLGPNPGPPISSQGKSRKVVMNLGKQLAVRNAERKKAEDELIRQKTIVAERIAKKENERAASARKNSHFVSKSNSRIPKPTMAVLEEEVEEY